MSLTRTVASLDKLMTMFLRSLRHDINTCINDMCNGNVRLALETVKKFFGSGHVDTRKMINIYDSQGNYFIPLHEFQRALIYGDNIHFDPGRSPVVNLFDISASDPREHFLMPVLLAFLSSSVSSFANGFVQNNSVYEYLQSLNFTIEQVDAAIHRAISKKLISYSTGRIEQSRDGAAIDLKINSTGQYHLDAMLSSFTYQDAVVVDTPIMDPNFRLLITNAQTLNGANREVG